MFQNNFQSGNKIDPNDYLITWEGQGYLPVAKYLPHQLEAMQNHSQRFKVLVWHRKARKTYSAISEIVKQAHARIGVYWHIFPTYGEAFDAVWNDPNMLFQVIPEPLVDHINITNLTVYLKCGSIYQLKGADKPDALRGPNPYGVVFDEFATLKYEAWQVIEPILRANGGWAWFIGTPKGKNHLFDFYQRGQSDHKEWKSWLLRATESGIITSDQLAEARNSMREDFYRQEFECFFVDAAGSVFRGVKEVMTSKPIDPSKPEFKDKLYVMGVDLARVVDYTVIRVFDRETNSLVYSDRFQSMDWKYQKNRISTYAKWFNNALVVIDATGLGDPVADDLIRAGVSVVPFKITEQSKKDIIEKLVLWIEQKRIKLLPQQEALLEYENFSYEFIISGKEIETRGRLRYGARQGFHDDIILADALAVWHLSEVFMPEIMKEPTYTQVAFARAKADYTRQIETADGEEGIIDDGEWASDPSGGY